MDLYRTGKRKGHSLGLCFVFILVSGLIALISLAHAEGPAPQTPADLVQLPIEQLMGVDVSTVFGASRYEQRISDAPASINIITSEDIKRYGYRTIADILNGLPGLHVTYDRNYNYPGLGGFLRQGDYNTKMLLLVDGHRINNNIYDTATIGREFILDVDLIDRIEVIHGPGSSLYGSNAFFGVINVITKTASHIKGLELSAEAASFDTDKERASFGRKFGRGLEMLFSATRYRSLGQDFRYKEFAVPETNNGWSDNNDLEQYSSFFTNISYGKLNLQGAYGSRAKTIPTGAWNSIFNDDRTETVDAQGYIDLKYRKRFENASDLTMRVFYDYYRFDGKYILDYPPVTMNKDLAVGNWWGAESHYTARIAGRHTITGGIEYRDNFVQKQKNFDENPYTAYLDDNRASYSIGAYAQGEFILNDALLINVGARYDHYKDFRGSLSPRIALIYTPFEKTAVKLIYGEAYRIPNTYERYYNDGNVSQKANPGLDPETIRTYQLVVEKYIEGFRMAVTGFYYDVEDLISLETDGDGVMVFRNTAQADGKGIQFEVEKKWPAGIGGRFSYSFQEVGSNEEDISFRNFPRHLAKLNIFTPLIKNKLSAGFELQYVSPRQNLDMNYDGGYTLINATFLSDRIFGNLDLSFSIYNVLDKKYSDPASREHIQSDIGQDGRVFRLKATYRF